MMNEDNERLRAIVDNVIDGIVTIDHSGIIETFNPAAERIFGYTEDEVIGKNVKCLMPEPYHSEHDGYLQNYQDTNEAKIIGIGREVTGQRKDGSTFPMDLAVSGMKISGIQMFTGIVRDITERRQIENELANKIRELDFQKATLDEHAIVSIADVKGNITYINEKFCEISGYSREELLGQNHRILKSDEHSPEFYDKLWRSITNGETWHGEIKNLKKGGSHYWVDATIVPFLNEQGQPFQYVAIRTDITERMIAKEEAETANQAKSEFLSSMSHELRTPLNAILGFSQMLGRNPDEPLTEKQRDSVDHIMKGGYHLLELINEVLDLAKVEAGKLDLSIEDVSPADSISDCLSLVARMAQERGIDLPLTDPEDRLRVRADHTRFKQVLLNLITNAVKYNRENGRITIKIEEAASDRVRIAVTDTGNGIPDDKLEELFEPFNRLKAGNTAIEGTGIGLTITKRLVEGMDGQIGVDSTVGKGSTFWIELPAGERKSADEGEGATGHVHETANDEARQMPDVCGTVLYVEDNPSNLNLMKVIVKSIKGVSLISAHTAELGIELARQRSPDLIILDINLPGINGFQALKTLQFLEQTKDIPVIALSANAMPRDIEKGIEAGFAQYLTKPIDVDEVADAIGNILG